MKLFPEPELEAGESIRQSWLANRTQSRVRAVGGRLYLTDRRLAFVPHIVDAALGGEPCSLPLAAIVEVGLQPGEFSVAHLFDGGLRTRLRVATHTGAAEHYVVESAEEVRQTLCRALNSLPATQA